MSTTRRRLPGYLLHKPTGQARVRIAGRDFYLGVYDTPESRERYHQLLAARKCPGANITVPSSPRHEITVTELAASYLQWAATYYTKNGRATSQVDVIRMSLRVLRNLYGSTEAAKIGPRALEALQQSLVDGGRTRSYVNKVSAELRRLFKWAARKKLVQVTVSQALATVPGLARGRTTARENAPVLPVDDATVEATLPHMSRVLADMVRFQVLVDCRSSGSANPSGNRSGRSSLAGVAGCTARFNWRSNVPGSLVRVDTFGVAWRRTSTVTALTHLPR